MAQGDGADTQQHRGHDVEAGSQQSSRTQQVKRLQAERGEGGEAPTKAHHDEEPGVLREREAPVGERERAEEADEEGAGDVDPDGAPGEVSAEGASGEEDEVAREGAECAAEGDEEAGCEGHARGSGSALIIAKGKKHCLGIAEWTLRECFYGGARAPHGVQRAPEGLA